MFPVRQDILNELALINFTRDQTCSISDAIGAIKTSTCIKSVNFLDVLIQSVKELPEWDKLSTEEQNVIINDLLTLVS